MTAGLFVGIALTAIVLHFVFKKKIDKLEDKIFKLEGWQ